MTKDIYTLISVTSTFQTKGDYCHLIVFWCSCKKTSPSQKKHAEAEVAFDFKAPVNTA